MPYDITARLNVALNQGDLTRITKQLNQITSPTSNTKVGISVDTSSLQKANSALAEAKSNVISFGEQSGLAARRFGAFTLAAGGLIQISQGFKTMVSEAIVFDKEMVRLKQVSSDAAGSGVAAIRKEIDRLSTGLGVSSTQLARVSVVLKQANLSLGETKSALEALALSALAPNFDSMEKTAEGAIAIMKQFKVPAEELASALGAVNAVAGEFAVEASDLISVIQRTGGAFKAAGGSLNELLALFTSVRQTTRESAESIATGLRTIFTRLQRTGTADALKEIGVNLRYTREEALALNNVNLTNQFVGAYEAVSRLSAALNEIPATDPKFARLVEEIGGYRQISKVIPLIQEFSVSQQALNVAIAGGSSLMSSAQAAQGSFGNRLDKIAESYLSFGRYLSDTSSFKTMFTMFEMAAKSGLILLEVLKPLLPMLTTIATISIGKNIGSFGAGFATTFAGKPTQKSAGGPIGFKNGGIVPGHGSGDIVPAMLEPGERVIPKRFANAGPIYENVNMSAIKNPKKFEETFKDSMFRDKKTGEHKVGFHGTQSDIEIFERNKTKRNLYGKGFYHTSDRSRAAGYASSAGNKDAKVMANALNMRNPYEWDSNKSVFSLTAMTELPLDSKGQIDPAYWRMALDDGKFPYDIAAHTLIRANKILKRSPKLRDKWESMPLKDKTNFFAHAATKGLQKQGYDSVNVDYGGDTESGHFGSSVVFKSNQIKSLSGNDGSWDRGNSNINKALGGTIPRQRFALAGKVEKSIMSTGTIVNKKTRPDEDFVKGKAVNDSDNILYKISKFKFDDPDSAGIKDIQEKGAAFEKSFADKFGLKHTTGNYPVDFFAGEQAYELKNYNKDVSEPELISKLLRHRKLTKDSFFSNTNKGNEIIDAGELKVVYNSSNLIPTQKNRKYKTITEKEIENDKSDFEAKLAHKNKNIQDQAWLRQWNIKQAALVEAPERIKNRSDYRKKAQNSNSEIINPEIDSILAIRSRLAGQKVASGGFIVPGVGNTDSVPMDLASGSYVIRKSSTKKLGLASGGIVPALLTPGEAVFNPETADKIGSSSLERMNKFGKFATGGRVGFASGGKGGAPFYGLSGPDAGNEKLSAEQEKMVAGMARWLMLTGQASDYTVAYIEGLKQLELATQTLIESHRLAAASAADPQNVGLAAQSAAATAQANTQAGIVENIRTKNEETMDYVSGQVYGETSAHLQSFRIDPIDAMAGSGLPGTNRGLSIGSASKDIAAIKIASAEARIKSDLIKKIEQQILTIDSSISSENAAAMADKEYSRIRSGQSQVLFNKKGESIGTSGFGDVLTGMGKDPAGQNQKYSAIKNFLGFGSAGAGASPEEKAAQKQSNMMQRTMLMAGASSYGMEFLNSQISKGTGKDAAEAVEKKTEGSFAVGQSFSGGATGAMTGGLMAASMGLSGPLIGVTAVAIGLYSAFNALKEATIALAKAEQERQETKTKDFLRDTVSGKIKGDSSDLNNTLSDIKNSMLKVAKSESGMFDSERDVLLKTNKNMEKFLGDNNPQIAKSASMGIKESIINAGEIKDVEKFVQELIKGTPAIQENIAMSRKAGETLAQATEKIKNDAIRMAKAANNVEPMKKFNQALQSQAVALKTFSDATNVALVRMIFLGSSFDQLSDVLDNPIRSIGMGGLNKNAQIISSPEGFSKEEFIGALDNTFSQFGKFGQQSIQQFEPLSQIGALLPNLIAMAGTDKDPATKLEELLKNTLGAENQNTNKIIASIMARVQANDNFGAEANQDPSKLAEELLAPFMGPLQKYGKLINSLQLEFANKFSASLAKLSSTMIKYFSDIEKKFSMVEDLGKMRRQGLNLLETGADPNVADPKRALMFFEESQNRLLSNGRKMDNGKNVPNNIDEIKRELIDAVYAQSTAQVRMDQATNNDERTDAMNEFAAAGNDIHVFRTALENFVSKSGQLVAEFDKQIGELLSQRSSGIEAIKKYAMSDPQSKMQFHQGQNLFKMLDSGRMNPAMAVNNPEILKSMYSFADSMGDFKVFKDSQGNDVTAKQSLDTQLFLPILKQMRPDLGDDKLRAMISGRNSVQERAIEAQSALNDVSKKLIDAIKVNLINSQQQLITQMSLLTAQMTLNYEQQLQIDGIRKKEELEKVEKQAKDSGFTNLNLDNQGQKDFIEYTKQANFVKYLEQEQSAANQQDKMGFNKEDIEKTDLNNMRRIGAKSGKIGRINTRLTDKEKEHNARIDRLTVKANEIDIKIGGKITGNESYAQIETKVKDLSASTGMNEEKSRHMIKKANEDGNKGSAGLAILKDRIASKKNEGIKITPEQQKFYDEKIAKNIKTLEIKSAVEAANSLEKLGLIAGGVAAQLIKLAENLANANQQVADQQAILGIVVKPPEQRQAQDRILIKSGGGFISAQGFASGGPIYRRDGGDSGDVVPAMLTAGEFVMNKGSVSKYGRKFMSDLNGGNISARQNEGGVQLLQEGGTPKPASLIDSFNSTVHGIRSAVNYMYEPTPTEAPWKRGRSYNRQTTSKNSIRENLSAGGNDLGNFVNNVGGNKVVDAFNYMTSPVGMQKPQAAYEAKTPFNGYSRPVWSGAGANSSKNSIGENLSAGFAGFKDEITNPNMPAAINEVATGYSTMAANTMASGVGVKPYVQIIDNSHPPVENTDKFKKASDAHQAYRKMENFYKVQAYQNWKNANEAEALVNQPSIWRRSLFGFLGIRGERLERERISKEANEYKEFGENYHNERYAKLIENKNVDYGYSAAYKRLTEEEKPEFQAQQKEAKLKAEEQKDKDRIKDIEDRDNLQTPLQQHSAIEEQGRQNQAKKDYDLVLEQENEQTGPDAPKHGILLEPQAVLPPRTPEQMKKFWEDRAAQEEEDRRLKNERNKKAEQQDIAAGRKPTREQSLRDKIRFDFKPPYSQWSHLNRHLQKAPMEYTDNAMDGISKYDFQAAVSIKDIWQDYVRGESGTSLMGGRQKEWANLSGGDGQIISEELKGSQNYNILEDVLSNDFDKKINMDKTFSFFLRNDRLARDVIDKNMDLSGMAVDHLLHAYGRERPKDINENIIDLLRGGAYPELFREKHYNKDIAQKFSKAGLMRMMSEQQKKPGKDDYIIAETKMGPHEDTKDSLQQEIDRLTLLYPNGAPKDIKIEAERNLGRIPNPNAEGGKKSGPKIGANRGEVNQLNRTPNRATLAKERFRLNILRELEFSLIPAYGKALDEYPAMLQMMKEFKEPATKENIDKKIKLQGLFTSMYGKSLQSIADNKNFPFGSDIAKKLMAVGLISPFTNTQHFRRLNSIYSSQVVPIEPDGVLRFIGTFIKQRKAASLKDSENLSPEAIISIRNRIQELKNGGIVPKGFADGGHVGDVSSSHKESAKLNGFIPRGTDTVPAMLSAGEFVIKKSSVDKYGGDTLGAINKGTMNLASGGSVGSVGGSGGSGGSSADMTPFMESSRKLTDAINALSGGFGSFTESVGSFNASVGQFGEFANIFAQGAAMIPQSILMQTENQVLVDMMNMAPAANAIAANIMPLIQQEIVNTINMMNMNNPSYIAQNSGGT